MHLTEPRYRIRLDQGKEKIEFQVRMREESRYTTRLFRMTYEKTGKHLNIHLGKLVKHHKIHIDFEGEPGITLFKELIELCFPNAVIQICQ